MTLEYFEASKEIKEKIRESEVTKFTDKTEGTLGLIVIFGMIIGLVLGGISFNLGQTVLGALSILLGVATVVLGLVAVKRWQRDGMREIKKMRVETATVKMVGREHIQEESRNEYYLEVMDVNSVMENTIKIKVSSAEYDAFKVGKTAYVARYGKEHKLRMVFAE